MYDSALQAYFELSVPVCAAPVEARSYGTHLDAGLRRPAQRVRVRRVDFLRGAHHANVPPRHKKEQHATPVADGGQTLHVAAASLGDGVWEGTFSIFYKSDAFDFDQHVVVECEIEAGIPPARLWPNTP